jgi:hypothetical protein
LLASVIALLVGVAAFAVAPTARDCLVDGIVRCGENDGARYLRAAGSGVCAIAGGLAFVGLIRGGRASTAPK